MIGNDVGLGDYTITDDFDKYPSKLPFASLGAFRDSGLYKPLVIDRVRFMEAYNLDIEDYIERNKFRETAQSKGAGAGSQPREIWYLSHSHAMRLFKTMFPELAVQLEVNPETNGFIFKEIDCRGYFIKGFIHDGLRRTQMFYYPVLDTTGQAVLPDDKYPDKKDKETGKVYAAGRYKADGQLFAKSIWRAEVRFIAFATGLSLKLWTGDDLSSEVQDAKMLVIEKVLELADEYKRLSGKVYPLPELNYITPTGEINACGKQLVAAVKELRQSTPKVADTALGIAEQLAEDEAATDAEYNEENEAEKAQQVSRKRK